MTNEALEKAWELMKARYTGMDGNRTRERRGKCSECRAKQTWDPCGLLVHDPRHTDHAYAFECPNFQYTE